MTASQIAAVNRAYLIVVAKPLHRRPSRYWPELSALPNVHLRIVREAVALRNTWEASCIARWGVP